jgi:hypothetical protein
VPQTTWNERGFTDRGKLGFKVGRGFIPGITPTESAGLLRLLKKSFRREAVVLTTA